MKSFSVFLAVVTYTPHEGAAFSATPPFRLSALSGPREILHAVTVGSSTPRSRDDASPDPPCVLTSVEQRQMETIRRELIEKYVVLGHSEEYAASEVNYFLQDSERSAQYVEMRRIAMARGNDLGIENFVQFAGAFVLGMLGSWILNRVHEIQAIQTGNDGELPLIS